MKKLACPAAAFKTDRSIRPLHIYDIPDALLNDDGTLSTPRRFYSDIGNASKWYIVLTFRIGKKRIRLSFNNSDSGSCLWLSICCRRRHCLRLWLLAGIL